MNLAPDPQRRAAIQAEATAWWVRLDSGKLDARQHQAFLNWLNQGPAHRSAFVDVTRLWGELDTIKPLIGLPHPSLAQRISNWFGEILSQRSAKWSAGLVLCTLLLWFGPLGLWFQADFRTGVGEMRSFKLSDGSTVHLNSNSALAVNISNNSRQLSLLKGEALFEVSADKSRPFRVHAENGTVTALGTAFNIRLQHDSAEVTVTEHSVAVDLDEDAASTRLEQGQRLVYDRQHGIGAAQSTDISTITAWQRGKLLFQNQPLGEVIAELNRYHHGLLLINDDSIAQRRVNGVFRTDNPLAVISALESSLQLHSTRVGDYLILLHR